jgi:c-di-GMP-binding flagellar brake protein YcgR
MPKNKYAKYRGPERRKYLRIPSHCIVRHIRLSDKLRPLAKFIMKSYMRDICAAGIKFVVREKMPLHTVIEFQFNLPGIKNTIDGVGEVVRIKPRSDKRSYNVGMKFVWIQQRNAELIDRYVRKKMIQQITAKLRKK